ncbi:flagellar biosynthesis regulator FlaF [Paremcibacter congregatus]|uniref:Flagellar FlaF family protein n=1 Tax=Paremcibacter congregatus TaxID=2043170 RepID=A0A2G4YLZ9_9PROT|nr:flagellar biosynthesis regulator FlaF [Paremcibacter congregatus]PHZ83328.1 flagellar FlaF family protein [Paremcibacter congregatus]QDE28199.1 flagellar biosynthesis regulator FlaF [Paremcibacter congregatus]|tara:strand:+ start:30358 stop:30771 length:414 start_codon:yes stop_codon:yes gene_type:complete
MSLKAYQTTQKANESSSQTEYRLFTEVTRALMEAKGLAKLDKKVHDALHWNRQLWSTLATDCAVEGNMLPKQLRASIISLSIWVGKYSSQVARGEEDIQSLIDINKNIMEGLSAQAQNNVTEAPTETPPSSGHNYSV